MLSNLQAFKFRHGYFPGNFLLKTRKSSCQTLREKCRYSELFWSTVSRLGTEYGDILRFSLYSVRMLENAGQNNSEYGHFLRSEKSFRWYEIGTYDLVNIEVQFMFQAFLLLQNTGVYLQFYSSLS